jgi:hypothetical protein
MGGWIKTLLVSEGLKGLLVLVALIEFFVVCEYRTLFLLEEPF